MMVMSKYTDWPVWLKVLVVGPNGLLLWFIAVPWFPKSMRQWIWTGIAVGYLAMFFLVMHFVFGL
jgi:hypothetical protein